MPAIERDEFREAVTVIRGDIHRVDGRLETLSERLQQHETRVALLEQRVGAAGAAAVAGVRWWGHLTSSASAAALVLLVQYLVAHLSR